MKLRLCKKAYFPQKKSPTLPNSPLNQFQPQLPKPNQIVINIKTPTPNSPQPSHFSHYTNSNYPSFGYLNFVSPFPNPRSSQANNTLKSLMNGPALINLLIKEFRMC